MLPSCLTSQRSAYTTPPLPWWLWRAQGMSAVAYGYGQYKRLEALHRWCVGAEDYARATCCQEAFSYTFLLGVRCLRTIVSAAVIMSPCRSLAHGTLSRERR
jgi:hypothetical protein